MTVKEYLEQAKCLDERILFEKQECQHLREMAQSLRSPSLEQRVDHSSDGEPPFVKELEKLAAEEKRMEEDIRLMVKLKLQIAEIFRQVRNPEGNNILRQHYLRGRSLDSIAIHLNCSRAAIYRRWEKALRKIRLPKDAINLNQSQREEHAESFDKTG